jgi:hypothetical protein
MPILTGKHAKQRGGFGRPRSLTSQQVALGRRLVEAGSSVREVARTQIFDRKLNTPVLSRVW